MSYVIACYTAWIWIWMTKDQALVLTIISYLKNKLKLKYKREKKVLWLILNYFFKYEAFVFWSFRFRSKHCTVNHINKILSNDWMNCSNLASWVHFFWHYRFYHNPFFNPFLFNWANFTWLYIGHHFIRTYVRVHLLKCNMGFISTSMF